MKSNNESSQFVESILNILSKLPFGLRTSIMKNRMDEFLSFDDEEKNEIVLNIFMNYPKIDETSLNNLIDSWLSNLVAMPNGKINELLYRYLLMLSINPAVMENFNKDIINKLSSKLEGMSDDNQTKLKNCVFEMILNTPAPDDLLALIPKDLMR
ncbi:MAG: hypothetical protein AB7V56_05665 [Candidatus Nitrosocosmicus sp.]|nr:hypothetical protein [Candidatus Nitrosocosmicus sp.]